MITPPYVNNGFCFICNQPYGSRPINDRGVHVACNDGLFGREPEYPEHARKRRLKDARPVVEEVITWLKQQDHALLFRRTTASLVEDFLKIDDEELEREKDAMMRVMRLRLKYPHP